MKDERFSDHLFRRLTWAEVDPWYVESLVRAARAEDIEGFGLRVAPKFAIDVTTMSLTPDLFGRANLAARKDMVVCGLEIIPTVLKIYAQHSDDLQCSFHACVKDGAHVKKGEILGHIEGAAKVILQAERVMLNFLQHLSGIATNTRAFADAIKGCHSKLLDTRKTTPLFRVLEKYAVACGGGVNHRMGLFDRVMLKDNHLAASSSARGDILAFAVAKAKKMNPDLAVEVEVDHISQIPPVLEADADVIMFDNFSLEDVKKGIAIVGDKAWTECSGGVTLDSIKEIASLGPDFVSTGALVHKSVWQDIGLDWV